MTATTQLAPPPVTGRPAVVTPSSAVVALAALIGVLAAIVAAVGMLAGGGPGQHTVASLHGQSTTVYGTGLYRYDSLLVGVGNRGTDAVTLLLEVPVLLLAAWRYRRGSLRAALVLVGVLGWLLYYYASMSFATAYNRFFPVYVALFAASLFALPLSLRSIDGLRFAAAMPARPSRRVLVGYLGGLALVLAVAWAPSLVADAVTGHLPSRLGSYTTQVTWALDLAVVVPAVAASALLLHRRAVFGPLAAASMLSLNVALGVALLGQGLAQLLAEVPMTAGERLGAMASFAVMTVIAATLFVRLLRGLPPASEPEVSIDEPT